MVFICYPKCTTCQKARKWLDEHKIAYELRDIKTANPACDELAAWHERSGMAVRKPVWQQVGMPYACLPSKAASQPRALVEIRPVPSPVNSAQMTRL